MHGARGAIAAALAEACPPALRASLAPVSDRVASSGLDGGEDGAAGVSVKAQRNAAGVDGAPSGGCFPLHYDNAGPPSRRALTCLV